MKQRLKRSVAAVVLFLLATMLFLTGLLDGLDRLLIDTIYSALRPVDQRIFVIGIDSATLDRYGPWGSWSRKLTADLIDHLNSDPDTKPAVIGVDILFAGETTDREDGALVDAAKLGGNVVFASQVIFAKTLAADGTAGQWNYSQIERKEEPFSALKEVASCGIMNVLADPDGIVRRGLYQANYNGQTLACFAAEIARVYSEATGVQLPPSPPLNARGEWFVPFAAQPGEYFGTGGKGTSWVRVMDGEIPRELFDDAIVLIGPYSAGMMDSFFTAADRRAPMYGVEIHANMLQNLLEGNYKQEVPGYLVVIFTAMVSVLLYLIFFRSGMRIGVAVVAAACGVYLVGAGTLFRFGWMLPLFYPVITFVLIFLSLLIANYIMLTVEKASLYDQMHRLFVNSIRTIANTIDAKDPCTSGHCQRVSDYSLMLGKGLHFSEEELSDLEYAALLHDVGKIGVSDNVLKKEGPLTDDEYCEMKTHPMRGALILSEIQEFRGRITDGAKYHHERYDGKGYGDGLKGEEIPLFGRVIAIADTFDAMTQNRPYRRRLSKEKAVEELKRCAGTQFDPVLVELFIHLLEHCPPPVECAPEKDLSSTGVTLE